MRVINRIVIHCSATRSDQDIGVEVIRKWHKEGNGWSDIGYHIVIRRDGRLEPGRPIERPGAHARNFNSDSIGICIVGGIDESGTADSNFTFAQFDTLRHTVHNLISVNGNLEVLGHRDLPGVTKACPCFDVRSFFNVE